MLSRGVYVERGAALAALGITPLVVSSLGEPVGSLEGLWASWSKLFILFPAFIAFGVLGGLWRHHRTRIRTITWGGEDETVALLKQAAAEFVNGKANGKMLASASQAANAQEGRLAGLFFSARIEQLRRAQAFQRSSSPNPVPLGKRLTWTLILALASCIYLLWPVAHLYRIPAQAVLFVLIALLPIHVTAMLIVGAGIPDADGWLTRLGNLRSGRSARKKKEKIKLHRGGKPTSVAGQWHKRSRGTELPVLRGTLILVLAVAGSVFFLREYGDLIFPPRSTVFPEQRVSNLRPATPPPSLPPRPTPAPVRQASRGGGKNREAQQATPPPTYQVPTNGVLISANLDALNYAGWDAAQLDGVLTRYKQTRLDDWYRTYLNAAPLAKGHVIFTLELRPAGQIGDISVIDSQFGTDRFENGLIDRLHAMDLGTTALDPVTITLGLDFRP